MGDFILPFVLIGVGAGLAGIESMRSKLSLINSTLREIRDILERTSEG